MQRSYESELMDGALQDPELLAEDLRNLRLMNRLLGGSRVLLFGLQDFLRRHKLREFSLLDIGTGSADIPAAITRWSRKEGIRASIVAVENQTLTARIAAAQTAPYAEISLIQGNAGALPFRPRSFDVVTASQILHHFSDAAIVALLRQWAVFARRAIIIGDLIRHPVAYYGIYAVTKLWTRNAMTIHDAALSVRRALTVPEWRELFLTAGVGDVEIRSVAPFRVSAVISLESN
jgi:SAM-dependent methyltransferase